MLAYESIVSTMYLFLICISTLPFVLLMITFFSAFVNSNLHTFPNYLSFVFIHLPKSTKHAILFSKCLEKIV